MILRSKVVFALGMTLVCGNFAQAISVRGGGGAVLCYDTPERLKTVDPTSLSPFDPLRLFGLSKPPRMLDLVEASYKGGAAWQPANHEVSAQVATNNFLVFQTSYQKFAHVDIRDFQSQKWGDTDLPLPFPLYDTYIDHDLLPANCTVLPVAANFFELNMIAYQKPIYDRFSETDQLALRFHEQLYSAHMFRVAVTALQREPYRSLHSEVQNPHQRIARMIQDYHVPDPYRVDSQWVRKVIGIIFSQDQLSDRFVEKLIAEEPLINP